MSAIATPAPLVWVLSPEEAVATAVRVEKINARLTKRGYTGLVELTVGEARRVTETGEGGVPVERVVVDVTLSGRPAQYDGWEFVAAVDTIETDGAAEFVLRCAPGAEVSEAERAMLEPFACRHCGTRRPNRRYTFLLRNAETGEATQVGKSCMADFLGTPVSPTLFVADVDEEIDKFVADHSAPAFSPETVVAAALAIADTDGFYVSRDRAELLKRPSTASLVSTVLLESGRVRAGVLEAYPALLAPDTARAGRVIAELLEAQDSSAYLDNLRAVLRAGVVEPKHIALTASAVVAHRMVTERAEERAEREAQKAARAAARASVVYAGEVGEKITVTGTIERKRWIATQYGSSALVIVDAGAHVLKMFTTAAWADDAEEGQTVTLTATVKAHQEYEGTRQTVVTRAKVAA